MTRKEAFELAHSSRASALDLDESIEMHADNTYATVMGRTGDHDLASEAYAETLAPERLGRLDEIDD